MIINARNILIGNTDHLVLEISLGNSTRYSFMLTPYKNPFSKEAEFESGFGIEHIMDLHKFLDDFLKDKGYR